jgi:hypothetical protein
MPERIYDTGDTELFSEQVREIISYRPNWVVRKGNALFFVVLFTLFLITFFVSTPDIINAPAKILVSSSLYKNELDSSGQDLFYIKSVQSQFYAEITASQKGLGKIKPGQQVVLKLESYPSGEFGSIRGIITHIADTPGSNDSFLITVSLPHGLQTNYGKNIFYRTGLKGEADIITDNRVLFDRLAGQLKNVWKR